MACRLLFSWHGQRRTSTAQPDFRCWDKTSVRALDAKATEIADYLDEAKQLRAIFAASYGTARRNYRRGKSARDPMVFAAVSVLVAIATLAACVVPGRRAIAGGVNKHTQKHGITETRKLLGKNKRLFGVSVFLCFCVCFSKCQQAVRVFSTERSNIGRSRVPAMLPMNAATSHSHPCRLPEAMPLKKAPMLQP